MQRNNIIEFKKIAPPPFKETTESLEDDSWIMKMEKAFAVQGATMMRRFSLQPIYSKEKHSTGGND